MDLLDEEMETDRDDLQSYCSDFLQNEELPTHWTTTKGEEIAIKLMSKSHLLNTIFMIATGRSIGSINSQILEPHEWAALLINEYKGARLMYETCPFCKTTYRTGQGCPYCKEKLK